jgi:hypothetical protein
MFVPDYFARRKSQADNRNQNFVWEFEKRRIRQKSCIAVDGCIVKRLIDVESVLWPCMAIVLRVKDENMSEKAWAVLLQVWYKLWMARLLTRPV